MSICDWESAYERALREWQGRGEPAMSDVVTETLTAKVARLAGWILVDTFGQPTRYWTTQERKIAVRAPGELTADGLRILIDELLQSGYAIIGMYRVCEITPFDGSAQPIETTGDTLDEAVMLAYAAMKEPRDE